MQVLLKLNELNGYCGWRGWSHTLWSDDLGVAACLTRENQSTLGTSKKVHDYPDVTLNATWPKCKLSDHAHACNTELTW